jgi:hypothetical protein
MGDIIWGTFLIILTLGVFGVYRFFTRKKVEQRSFIKFISLLLILGALIGVLTTGLNARLYDHPYIYFLTLVFFILQTSASILCYRTLKIGLPLLILTLLLQIPLASDLNFSYRNQTMFSFVVKRYPGKFFDLEPGSYVHFIYSNYDNGLVENNNRKLSLGVNLVPLLTIIAFWKNRKQSDK